jgi:CheY-like chemotaxis protein
LPNTRAGRHEKNLIENVKSILIVEDEPDNQKILRAVVEELLGHRALLAEDGKSAMRIIREEQPALVLMDLLIPVMNGFETIRLIRNDSATASLPVIALTALGRPVDRQRAIDSGADDYISKPFDLEKLIAMIERLLNSYQDGTEN